MTRPTPRIVAAVLLLAVALIALGTIGGLTQPRADSWPMVCAEDGRCAYATVTPVVWGEATAAAVATWEAGNHDF